MDKRYEDVQARYVVEMRSVLPSIIAWWDDRAQSAPMEIRQRSTANAFELRWPAGPAAHPRILEIFRRYFLEINDLNDTIGFEDTDVPPEEAWGEDIDHPGYPYNRPIDVLVNDLTTVAPDLHEILQGLVYIPVGADPSGEFR